LKCHDGAAVTRHSSAFIEGRQSLAKRTVERVGKSKTLMRNNYEKLPTAKWTDDEATHHLTSTFARSCRTWPGLMERYLVEIADAPAEQHEKIMRRALSETVNERK
jgi:hypothetical protein